jgi:L-ascorbate metabolism protein UlaG (beta-lactamase superfamily)
LIHKVFGKRPFGARLKRIETSANYKNGVFQNTEKTTVTSKAASLIKMTRAFLNKPKTVRPNTILPSVKTKIVNKESDKTSVIWFGHSSYRIQSKNFTVLVDPVFSGHASPFSFAIKAFEGADIYHIQDFNVIDLLVITHDHYDHLDYETVVGLKDKVKKIITPLGVGAHLEYWGFDPAIITELDWWEHTTIEKDIEITACPARHFSGRDFIRAKTLWASFALSIHGRKIFIGGDSGYDAQFKIIGDKHGPFDLAILENGQYGDTGL